VKRSRIARKTPLRSSGRLTPKNRSAADKAEKFAREYGSKDRVAWVKSKPCLVSGQAPSENAHTRNGGMGRKGPPESIVPLAPAYHRELHRIGIRSFEAKYANRLCFCSLARWAEIVEQAWQYHRAQAEPIASVVARVLPTLTGEGA
jgi:hypothetical protein